MTESATPYLDGVEQLLKDNAPSTPFLLAQLVVGGKERSARACCSNLYRKKVLARIDDDTYTSGEEAKKWLARPNKTNAGGNSSSYRRRKAAKEMMASASSALTVGTPSALEIRESALNDDTLLTARQAADELGVHKTTIIRRILKDKMRGYLDTEGRYMVYRADVHRSLTLVIPKGK